MFDAKDILIYYYIIILLLNSKHIESSFVDSEYFFLVSQKEDSLVHFWTEFTSPSSI